MEKLTIELPEGLSERRKILETELAKVIVEISFTGLRKDLNEVFEEFKVEPKPTSVEWEFYGEYDDDEGGTTYYPNNIHVCADGEEVEIKKYVINKKSKWSDDFYDYELEEQLHEVISEYREDLYEHNIESIDL